MNQSRVTIQKHLNLNKNFNFYFKIGILKEKPRFSAISQKVSYKGGPARGKSNKKAAVTNNQIMGYLYKKDIKVLNMPFLAKDKNLSKVGNYFANIGVGNNKEYYIKEAGKTLTTIVQDFMAKGKFGKNKKGFRMTIDTGQLAEGISDKFVKDNK